MSVSADAYTKAVLHAMKHPTQPVLGFLMGKATGADKSTFIADAVPILHTNGAVFKSPTVEIAFLQCQAVGRTKGLSVVGVYAANEHVKDNAVSETTKKWAGFIAEQTAAPAASIVVWQLNNSLVRADNSSAVAVVQYKGGNYRTEVPIAFSRWNTSTCAADAIAPKEAVERLSRAMEAFLHMKLWDFEEHLEDVSLDYFNQRLLTEAGAGKE